MSDHEGEVLEGEVLLTRTRQVDAIENGRPFMTVNKALQTEIAGHTQMIDYDSGKAKALVFIAPDGKQYSLGNPSKKQTHHTIIDHPKVVQPIVDAGFETMDIVHSRGGVSLFALFRHPDIVIPDSINWDSEQYRYGHSSQGEDGQLHLSIAAWADARVGKSIRLAAGYFRNICSNGLVSTILAMGSLRLTHNAFSKPKIDQFAEGVMGLRNKEFSTFSPKVLEYPIKLLDEYQRDQEGTLKSLPKFVRSPFQTALASQPNWFQDEALYQMSLANDSKEDLSALDILNVITNVNRAADTDSTMFRVESISEAFMSFLEISAFRMNVDFPHVVSQ